MGSRSRRPAPGGPPGLAAAAFVALCLLPTCSSREAHDATPTRRDVGSAKRDGRRALETSAKAAGDLAFLSARVSPRRALAQTPDASAAAAAPDAAAAVTASDLAALVGYMRDDVDRRVVTLVADVALADGESLPPVEKTIAIRGACGSSGTDACVLDARGSTRHVVVGAVGSLRLENVILRNGAATRATPPSSDGGAVYSFGAFDATRVAFENCTATADGTSAGGSVVVAGGRALFNECAFLNSVAADDGGAAFASSGFAEFRRCSFENCAAGGLGGGVAGDAASLTIRYCTFDDRVTAREEASRDAYVGARGAVYLEPFAIYADYYGPDGALLNDAADAEITGAELGPPEGFSYRAEGAGLVARAGFEPPPPGVGFAPPPPSRVAPSETNASSDASALVAVLDDGDDGVDRASLAFVASGVAAVIASLWMLGRFLSREHHAHRPSERTLKNMRAADDAMLEARRADDEAEAREKREAALRKRERDAVAAAEKEKERANLRGGTRDKGDAVALPRAFSAMRVAVEAGDEIDVSDDDERRDSREEEKKKASDEKGGVSAVSAASDAIPAALVLSVPASDEAEKTLSGAGRPSRDRSSGRPSSNGSNDSSEPGSEDDAFGDVENRARRREEVFGEDGFRGGAPRGGARGRLAGRRVGRPLDFDRNRSDEEGSDEKPGVAGVFHATRAKTRAEADFVRASWAGAAAAARETGFLVSGSARVPSDEDFFETRAQRQRASGSARTAAPAPNAPARSAARKEPSESAANARAPTKTPGPDAFVDGNPAVATRLASVASASTAARAALAMRRGAVGAGRGGATVRAGSADALRARVEAARRAARER